MDNYTDIHTHILYGIDDGSKTLEESIEIIKQHKKMGFKNIVLTPHYIENSKYKTNNKTKKEILNTIKKELKKQEIDINLYIGNEVLVNSNLEELLKTEEISSINNTKYLLIELPMSELPKDINNIIYELRIKGIRIIIAHPERYTFVQKNPNIVNEWIEEGAILQANYGSIVGVYGENAKKTIKKLLKKNVITILATDIHYPNNKIYLNMETARKKIKKLIGEQKSNDLMINNPIKIINNEEISNFC